LAAVEPAEIRFTLAAAVAVAQAQWLCIPHSA
jgi:hypothetical protein